MSEQTGTFSLWREEVKRAWRELRGPETTPLRAAVSVALGMFIGSLPIFGCHTLLLLLLCVWFRLDTALAWIASNISNPLFAPALLAAEAQIGSWVTRGVPLRLDAEPRRPALVGHFIGYLAVGSPLVGAALALGGAAVAYAIVALLPRPRVHEPYRLPDNAPPWVQAVERAARRFASPSSPIARERSRFHYLRAKMFTDPAAKLIADVAGAKVGALGSVFDVGTGRGQLPILLLELGRATKARGIDWDDHKIDDARRAAAAAGEGVAAIDAAFRGGDARTTAFEPADTVLMVDVLHYFTVDEQDTLLDRAADAVLPGGRLVVREADARRGWRSVMTLAEERLATLFGLHRGERVRFRSAHEIVGRLAARGLTCVALPAWGKTPFSNVLIVGSKEPVA